MKDLIALVQQYATAHGDAERHRALLECFIDDKDGYHTAKIAEYDSAAMASHAQLMIAYDELTRTTVRAVPDEHLPVCTWHQGAVEIRAVLPDRSRRVRVRYTPEQAMTAGTALIACAAVTDADTGGTLAPILPVLRAVDLDSDSTAAGATTKDTES